MGDQHCLTTLWELDRHAAVFGVCTVPVVIVGGTSDYLFMYKGVGFRFHINIFNIYCKLQIVFIIYYISNVNTEHMQRPDVLVRLGYIWRHVSAVNRPSSCQQRIVLLRYSQIICPVGSHCLH